MDHLSELGRIPKLDGAVVGAHTQKVPTVSAHPLHADAKNAHRQRGLIIMRVARSRQVEERCIRAKEAGERGREGAVER